jgi:type I restriction enzyme S subunit
MREDWEMKKLIEVCKLINGRAYKKAELLSEGKYPVLRVGNLFTNNQWYHSNLELNDDKYCDNQDLIYAWSASFGPRIWKGGKVIYHYHIWKVLPNPEMVTRDYLFHLFEWDKEQIKSAHGTGTTMMHVGKGSMENRVLPIPPIQEQKQIVALLDKAFNAIDQAKANIEKNIVNAKEFQISATNNLFNSIRGSELLTIDDITDLITDYVANGSFASLKENVNYKREKDYAVLLRLTDHSKKFKNDFVYVDKHSFDFLKKSTVLPNDIILSNVGARLGTAFRAPDLGMPMTLGPNAMLIKAEKLGDYLYCWLQSAYGQKAIKSVVSGAGQPKFNKTQFKKITVPIPKQESDRNEVVNKINLAESEFKNLYENYKKKLEFLEELKKSILQKAFQEN